VYGLQERRRLGAGRVIAVTYCGSRSTLFGFYRKMLEKRLVLRWEDGFGLQDSAGGES
jgi:hypothetical protein